MGPACLLLISSACLPPTEPERSLKPYSLVQPLLVPALRPVVLLPECLAPRLIRNLLDLPNSRLDFQVCPAGESLSWERGGRGGIWGSRAHWPFIPASPAFQKACRGRTSAYPQRLEHPRPSLPPWDWAAGSELSRSLLGRYGPRPFWVQEPDWSAGLCCSLAE